MNTLKTALLNDLDMLPELEPAALIDPEDLLPEEVFPVFRDKKELLIPRLQSMRNYIAFHYKKPIVRRLCKWIESGQSRMIRSDMHPVPMMDTFEFTKMTFRRYSRDSMVADIFITIGIQVNRNGIASITKGSFTVQLFFEMDNGIKCYHYAIDEGTSEPEYEHEAAWVLSDHLIPILRKHEIESHADTLLQRYLPNAWMDQKQNSPFELAKRMGLMIRYLPLTRKQKTRSILFYRAGTIMVEVEDKATHHTFSRQEAIAPKTIVINTKLVEADHSQLDIYHECVHYDLHYLFFRLQDMHNNDLRQIRKTHVIRVDRLPRKRRSDPLSWIEYQAVAGSFSLWMPRAFMQEQIRTRTAQPYKKDENQGALYQRIGRGIAEEFHIPKYRVRARLIRMGLIGARGSFNYIDDHYADPFGFDLDVGSGSYTFFISREQLASEYQANESFRDLIDTGRFIFADGHVCINDPRYVYQTCNGLRLTQEALNRVDLCCLRFIEVYEQDDTHAFRYGRLNSDKEYNERFLYFPPEQYSETNPKPSEVEQSIKNAEYQDSLPRSFPLMLKKLMADCDVTVEELADRSRLSTRTINNLRNKRFTTYSFDTLIAITVGLHLPPWVSKLLLASASFDIDSNPACAPYTFVFYCLYMDSMEQVKEVIEKIKRTPMDLSDSLYENIG